MSSKPGISVTLDLVDGDQMGIRIAQVTGWAGYALAGPRARLKDLLSLRDLEMDRTGVYILAGLDQESGRLCVYVGEGTVADRVRHHDAEGKKDFWTQTYCFANKDRSFNKALALYVESELVAHVRKNSRVAIANTTSPEKPDLDRHDINQAEHFLQQIAVVLPALGLDIMNPDPWQPPLEEPEPPKPSSGPTWVFMGAKARIEGKKTTVLVGSKAMKWKGAGAKGYEDLQMRLASQGDLRWINETEGVFARDVEFTSSSAAAAVVCGRSASGPASWKELDSLPDKAAVEFVMTMNSIGIEASARLNDDGIGLTVLSGSIVRGSWVGKSKGGSRSKNIEELVRAKAIVRESNGLGRVQRDISFSSPSAAASMVAGTSRNGKDSWKHDKTGETLGSWLQRHRTDE